MKSGAFRGKRVAVFGLGASGNATAKALLEGGAEVAAWDDSEGGRAGADKVGLPVVDLTAADWSSFSALILSPGVPLTHPEPHWTVKRALAAGIEVIGDVELFFRERAAVAPTSPVIAITGTNGKSTTTALIAHLLRELGLDVELGGNIGRAVLTLDEPSPDRVFVLELSSFQIDLTPTIRPTVGVQLNVTPDHIDRHGTLEAYAAVKERLVQGADAACVGLDDAISRAMASRVAPAERLYGFTTEGRPGAYATAAGATLTLSSGETMSIAGIRSLRGTHNAQNAAAAVSALRALDNRTDGRLNVWRTDAIEAALRAYPGLAHRMEEIGSLGELLFINDSKATNADSTEKALSAFARDIFWIAGGKPKEGGITALAPFFPRIAKAYLIGAATDEFAQTLAGHVPIERCGTLDKAVADATRDARSANAPEPVVLLSPACASYDQYKSFEHRGDHFRTLVAAIPGITLNRS